MPRRTIRRMIVCIAVLAPFVLLFGRMMDEAREAARSSNCTGQLKQFGLALHNYSEYYGCYPPAFTSDRNGNSLHSWRTSILPFQERKDLLRMIDFSVPWDHPSNALANGYDTPSDFWWCHSGNDRATKMTSFVAVVGPQTAWPGGVGRKPSEITDDPASTILVLEIEGSTIHWMQPKDPTIDEILATGLSSPHPYRAKALMADYSVRSFRKDIDRATLRALLTVNGGETISPDSWQLK
jgi:Protein of unknown function (DUF1559)